MLTCLSAYLQTNLLKTFAIQQTHLVEGGGALYAVDLAHQLVDLHSDICAVRTGLCAVLTFYCKLVHSLEHIMHFVQSALGGLHCADTILRVSGSLCQASYLSAHLLGNCKPCRIVSRTVDLVTGRELFCGTCLRLCGET